MNSETPKPDMRGVRLLVLFGGVQLFGQERANLEMLRSMKELGLEARFITHRKWGGQEIQPELDRLGFSWTTAPFGYHWTKQMAGVHFGYFLLNLYGLAADSWRIWREARVWRPTHLYVTHWEIFSFAIPALLWMRVPLVYRAGDELPVHTVFHRWLTRRLARRVTRMVCVSKFIMESCVAAGVPRERMQVIYGSPAARKQAESPELPVVPPGALVLAYVGQISEHKGVVLLLDAVRRMVGRGDNIVLWIAGKSDWGSNLLEQLKQQPQETGLEGRVHFFGYLADVTPVLEHCDVHVCPSLFPDPLPNVVNEAKQQGKPSVVFPAGGIPELIVHEVDGYICRESSVEALMEGIAYFLADAPRREAAGAAARKSLDEKFGRKKYQREWAEIFLRTKDRT